MIKFYKMQQKCQLSVCPSREDNSCTDKSKNFRITWITNILTNHEIFERITNQNHQLLIAIYRFFRQLSADIKRKICRSNPGSSE